MPGLMRCKYCGTLQDEPGGAKVCVQCGGELVFEQTLTPGGASYVKAQLELDQIAAPAGQIVERHLIVTVETPDQVPAAERPPAEAGRDPLNFVAVLDISGSMGGSKIEAAVEAARQAVRRLQDGDFFSLVTFSTRVLCPLASRRVDAGYRRVIESALQEIRAGGQTALCGGLEQGIEQALSRRQKTNLVLLLSDGQANVGETGVEAIGRRAMDARAQGVTVSTLGVGNDYNEALMAEIAIDGGGRFYHVAHAHQIAAYLAGELGEMASLAARNAVVTLDLPEGTGVHPLSSAYPVQGPAITLGDIPLSTTLEVAVRILLPPHPPGTKLPISGALRYRSPVDHSLTTPLNTVTVRYAPVAGFEFTDGTVKPVVRRVLAQMQATGVLSTVKAATQGVQAARRQGGLHMASMQRYASLLGEDQEAGELLAQSKEVLDAMVASSASPLAKAATHAAMKRHRGSKDFDQT